MINNKNSNKNNNNKKSSASKPTFGERSADKLTNVIGSWKFIITQTILLLVWIAVNICAWIYHWDPYPFILLNLVLSVQAAFAAPIIMMSQNRTAELDRNKVHLDLAMDRKTDRDVAMIKKQLNRIEIKLNKNLCITPRDDDIAPPR